MFRKLFLIIISLLLMSGCAGLQKKPVDYTSVFEKSAVATKMYGRDTLTGGTKSLDNIPDANLATGDLAIVIDSNKIIYFYRFNNDSTAAEASPWVIQPNDAGGNGDWELVSVSNPKKRYYPATLNDTTSPHQLLITECFDTIITTQGWNGTDNIEFDLPDISAYTGSAGALKVVFRDIVGMQDADTDFYIDPDASTQIVLNGTPTGTDGDSIWNDNITIYDQIVCTSDYDAALGGFWVCDTIIGSWLDKGGDAP